MTQKRTNQQQHRRRARAAGEGTIYTRKDGLWEGRLTIGYDENGKRIRRSVYGRTQGIVREKMDALRLQHRPGSTDQQREAPGNLTVSQFLEQWMAVQNIAVATRSIYQNAIDTHIAPQIGKYRIKDLAVIHITEMFAKIEAALGYDPSTHRPKGLRTLSIVDFLLRKALTSARKEFDVVNPMDSELVKRYPQRSYEAECMTKDEVRSFIHAVRGERLEPFFLLALHTGCRAGELFGLTWSDVDWTNRKLTIQRSISKVNGHMHLTDTKTYSSQRTISLGPAAISALQKQRELQKRESEQYCQGGCNNPEWFHTRDWIFRGETGHPLRRGNIRGKNRVLPRVLKRAGIRRHVTLHTFRHTHASLLFLNKTAVIVVSERLGHKDPNVTLRTYAHLLPGQDEQAVAELDQLIAVDDSSTPPKSFEDEAGLNSQPNAEQEGEPHGE